MSDHPPSKFYNIYRINREICEALGLDPRSVSAVTMKFSSDAPVITVDFIADTDAMSKIAMIVKRNGIEPTGE